VLVDRNQLVSVRDGVVLPGKTWLLISLRCLLIAFSASWV